MKSNIKRLFSYTLRYKLSFTISIIGFLIFAAADVAAVEWIRRVIEFINSSDVVNPLFIAIALILIAFARGLGFFIGNYFMWVFSSKNFFKFDVRVPFINWL